MSRFARDFAERHPEPGPDAYGHLVHTMDVHAEMPDSAWAVTATNGIYGPGVRTGLTWGDLRALHRMLNEEC